MHVINTLNTFFCDMIFENSKQTKGQNHRGPAENQPSMG